MYERLLDLLLALAAIAAIWQAAKLGLRALVYLIRLSGVIIAVTPSAYAAAKAEKALPARDLALDFDGNERDAKRLNAVVQARLGLTKVAARYPDLAWKAVSFGREMAKTS